MLTAFAGPAGAVARKSVLPRNIVLHVAPVWPLSERNQAHLRPASSLHCEVEHNELRNVERDDRCSRSLAWGVSG